ncbi:hypothetical protein COT48_01135, partial [Candidatus Woesearchaeota archaeon CG08_land_8_20_14_0_20_47_9]
MDFTHFLRLIHAESERLAKHYPCDSMDRETFARAVKLGEEVGELFSEILKHSALQRKEKMQGYDKDKESLAEEFADVIITSLLLAERMNIDIESAL